MSPWRARLALPAERYPALTGVRALGACCVFFDHFPLRPQAHLTINVMAFFYVLSGFLIVRIYQQTAQANRAWLTGYFVNRFARIYPVYFVLLTVAVCLRHDFHPWLLIKNYTLTHGLFYGTPFIIQPSWSLTVEECFYFLAPVFMLLARRWGFRAALALACLLSLAALGISTMRGGLLGTPLFVLSTTFFGHFAEFFAGVYLALLVIALEKRGPLRVPGAARTRVGLAGVAILVFAMVEVYRHTPLSFAAIILINNFLIPVPIAFCYFGLISESTLVARVLAGGLFRLLGRCSYSFYLLHTLVIDYVSSPLLARTGTPRAACVVLTFAVTWLLSVALFIWFEEPLNRAIRRRFAVGRVSGAPAGGELSVTPQEEQKHVAAGGERQPRAALSGG